MGRCKSPGYEKGQEQAYKDWKSLECPNSMWALPLLVLVLTTVLCASGQDLFRMNKSRLAMHGAQMSELKHKPWVEKDWMQWTVWDCQNTLNYSPWVYVNRGLGRETGPTIYAQDAFEFYPKQL